jgi:6-phosphogluconolactonase (cycloisomerase 2 family)
MKWSVAGVVLAAAAVCVLMLGSSATPDLNRASSSAQRTPTGSPQLISVQPLPVMDPKMCQWMPASAETTLMAALQQVPASRASASGTAPAHPGKVEVNRAPVRIIRDTYPTYAAIAQDPLTGDILLQDENLFGIRFFDRLTNTPPQAAFSEPKRMLRGEHTKLEFNCGLYVDPKTGDIYSVNNDTTDMLVIFEHKAEGDVPPTRELRTPHGTYGIAVDEEAEEMFMTVEHTNAIVVYNKYAQGTDKFLRQIIGNETHLEDPHGIAVDPKREIILVTNHGNARQKEGDVVFGKFEPASVTVYPLKGDGNVAPIRTIEGPKTEFNWPAHLWVDSERGEFYVANDGDDSILVFSIEDNGDVAPKRKIKGPLTQIKNPTGVFLDAKHDELWVSNMGNHRATVYERTANGNVAPKRVIRSAPEGKIAQAIGNPGAVGYDTKRDEVLVPN